MSEQIEEFDREENSEVGQCINAAIKMYASYSPASTEKYFEEVHQMLAPLARKLEKERNEALATIATLTSQVEALKAQLLTARKDALDEAANVCEKQEAIMSGYDDSASQAEQCRYLKSAILSLKG